MKQNAPEKDAWLAGELTPPQDDIWIPGILKTWFREKGFGFLERDDGITPDIFVHIRAILLPQVETVHERIGHRARVLPGTDSQGRPRAKRLIFYDSDHKS